MMDLRNHWLLIILTCGLCIFLCSVNAYADINADLLNEVENGNMHIVEELLANGADVNAKNKDGWSALMVASLKGHTEIVKALLANSADVNAKDFVGTTALMLASFKGHTETVMVLLAKGADVNANMKGGTALISASQEGHTEIVKALLANGTDVNAKDFIGRTALMLASFNGHTDIVKILLAKGADETALMSALENSCLKKILNSEAETFAVIKNFEFLNGYNFKFGQDSSYYIDPSGKATLKGKAVFVDNPNNDATFNKVVLNIGVGETSSHILEMKDKSDQIIVEGSAPVGSSIPLSGRIGVGSRLRFDGQDWTDFCSKKYRKGGVNITKKGLLFLLGTQTLSNETIFRFDGQKWSIME